MALPVINQAGVLDITIQQGSVWSLSLTINDADGNAVDLTGLTAAGKIIADFAPATTPTQEITVDIADASAGRIDLSLTSAETAALVGEDKSNVREVQLGFWDLELDDSTNQVRIVQGHVKLSREATK